MEKRSLAAVVVGTTGLLFVLTLFSCSSDPSPAPGAGTPDATVDTDAGDGDASDEDIDEEVDDEVDEEIDDEDDEFDARAHLFSIFEKCEAERTSDEDEGKCWKELLKEKGQVKFTPVARGELGEGPWPTSNFEHLGAAVGLDERMLGVGVDTGQNQYAISRDALYIRRAGEARFEKYRRGTNGIRDYPLGSIAGGGPGQAYLGLIGIGDQEDDPEELRKSGDVQPIKLEETGFSTRVWDTHNSNSPFSGKYDHTRQIYEIHVPRRGPAAGEVYLGTGHGIVRYQGPYYADHLHIETRVNGSQRFGNVKAMTVTDDGTVWHGNDFAFGGKAWAPRLYEWYLENPWIFPTWAFGTREDRDHYEGIGVDSTGRKVWVTGRTHGMALLTIAANGRSATLDTFSAPDNNTNDLVVDLDDTVWVAADSGLYHYVPDTSSWTRVSEVPGGVQKLFLDDTVTPRALYIVHKDGVTVYRGP